MRFSNTVNVTVFFFGFWGFTSFIVVVDSVSLWESS
jgi:hypothetical protein